MKWFLAFMVGIVLFWLLLFIFALHPKTVKADGILTCTIPSQGQYRWVDSSLDGDSVMVECTGSDTVSVDSIRLYRWQDGDFRYFKGYFVRGREGQTFTSDSLPPGQYTATAINGAGESCGGNVATVPGITTGVPTGEARTPEKPQLGRLYDVRGRLVQGKPAAGIYWTEKKKKVVILR